MKYPQIVAMARFEAAESDEPQVVYGYRPKRKWHYGYSTKEEFQRTLALGKFPMVQFLLCLPNGNVVQ